MQWWVASVINCGLPIADSNNNWKETKKINEMFFVYLQLIGLGSTPHFNTSHSRTESFVSPLTQHWQKIDSDSCQGGPSFHPCLTWLNKESFDWNQYGTDQTLIWFGYWLNNEHFKQKWPISVECSVPAYIPFSFVFCQKCLVDH